MKTPFCPEDAFPMAFLFARTRAECAVLALCAVWIPALLGGGCGRGERASSAGTASVAADSGSSVSVVAVRRGLAAGDLFHTFVEPEIDAPVVARNDGIVNRVYVEEGRRVRTGQALAELESEDQRLELDRAQALSQQAEAEYERAQKAIVNQLISQQELEVKRAQAAAARADASRAQLAYDRCVLRAPVGGVVRLVRARPHMLVEDGEVLFRVASTARLRVSLYLPHSQASRLTPGQAVQLRSLSDPSSEPAPARVRLVNAMADPATGLCHVEIEAIPVPGVGPGQEVRVEIPGLGDDAGNAPGLAGAVLPRGAYLERDGSGLFVYRVRDGQVERTALELGEASVDGYGVLAGLAPGDLVVASGQALPKIGAEVTPRLPGSR
jgi:membrane fusion protein (multidrug efflux system)